MSRHGRRGYVLIVALFVIVIVMTAAMLVAASLNRQMWLLRQQRQDVQLTALVDAGLAKALSQLWDAPDDLETVSEPFADGSFVIEKKKIDGLTVEVTVRASYWGGGRAARAVVRISRRDPPLRPRVIAWEPVSFR